MSTISNHALIYIDLFSTGHSVVLDIPIGTSLQGGLYKLQLKGSGGGIAFNSSTSVTMDIQSYLTFIQTDKSIYKPGQLGMK